mgnify:CR=1 FL=1
MTQDSVMKDAFWLRIIYIISIVITLAVAFLILGSRPAGMEGMLDVSGLPIVNVLLISSLELPNISLSCSFVFTSN